MLHGILFYIQDYNMMYSGPNNKTLHYIKYMLQYLLPSFEVNSQAFGLVFWCIL